MENALRATVRSIDPILPLTQLQTMEQAVSLSEGPRRFSTVLIGSFAFAAVLLAVLGIYSVISFSVASRVREMAIRIALGFAARAHCLVGLGIGGQAGLARVRDWVRRRSGGFGAAAVASIRCEPVRSGSVVSGSGGGNAASSGGFRTACAAGCIH